MATGRKISKELAINIQKKEYRTANGSIEVIKNLELLVRTGEIVVILGPSGCGKTTLLRMVVGLDTDFVGEISCGGKVVSGPGPDRGIMFQDPLLLPWMSVLQNIEFGIVLTDSARSPGHSRALEMLEMVGLRRFSDSWPQQLSGGMAQRVALARALVNLPDFLLLDEPFGALDMHTRFRLQEELCRILTSTGTTALLVTHDIDEALYLADRVAVMNSGPGTIVGVHTIPTPRMRDRTDAALLPLRAALLQEMIGRDAK